MESNNHKGVNSREIILGMLMEIYAEKEYSHILMRQVLEKYDYLDHQEKAFIKRVTEGSVERKIQLDYIINQFSNTPVNKMKPLIRALLRMSVYQLVFMNRIPDSAVCNEAVKLAVKRNFQSLKGFINGVLRNIARSKDQIKYPDQKSNPVEYFSVMFSMPVWLIEHWMKEKRDVEPILQGLLQEHPLTIRLKETLSEEEKGQVFQEFEEQGITASPQIHPCSFALQNCNGIARLKGFQEGFFTVQDPSSMFVATVADPKPGSYGIDVCAAPGGKTIHLAELIGEHGQVDAFDVSDYKLEQIQANIDRMKTGNVNTACQDARIQKEDLIEKADVVLCDIPCSGFGVIGKKRDIKYRTKPETVKELLLLQKEIVDNVQSYVKPGGVLVYSTCTINRQENEDMVAYILKNHPFTLTDIDAYIPEELQSETTKKGYLQFLPGKTDGFFLAKFTRQKR